MWNNNNHQSGFTLVELAIVLVIIGLILGAVLKGQEMISNGKIKSVANDLKGVASAYYAYQDRYKAIPGDDAQAANHVSNGTAGDGNGLIKGTYSASGGPLSIDTESQNFWQHARSSGFLAGNGSDPATNSAGGLLGVQGVDNTFGMSGNVVCAGSIPWKIAQAVDIMIDDGNGNTGLVRAGIADATNTPTTTTVGAAAYGEGAPADTETLHTVCMKI
jgi:prepilin-type N-terminal cleavage/methylation domain-containing protein